MLKIVAAFLIVSLMFKAGLDTDVKSLTSALRHYRFIGIALLTNYVLVPLYAVGVNRALAVPSDIAIGIGLMAVAAGAPFIVLSAGRKKGGSAGAAIDLAFLLSTISVIIAPLILMVAIPRGTAPSLHTGSAILRLVVMQFLPLVIGLAINTRWKNVGEVLSRISGLVSVLSIVAAIAFLWRLIYGSIVSVAGTHGLIAMLLVSILAMLTGFFLGGPLEKERHTLSIATALRNPGLGMTMATNYFAGSPLVVSAVVSYFIIQVITSTVGAIVMQRVSPTVPRAS